MRSILPLQLALVMTCVTLVHFLRPGRTRRYQPVQPGLQHTRGFVDYETCGDVCFWKRLKATLSKHREWPSQRTDGMDPA